MTSDRIEELMKQTAYPESNSVLSAMNQVWNELQQDFNSRICDDCKYCEYYMPQNNPHDQYNHLACMHTKLDMTCINSGGCKLWEKK